MTLKGKIESLETEIVNLKQNNDIRDKLFSKAVKKIDKLSENNESLKHEFNVSLMKHEQEIQTLKADYSLLIDKFSDFHKQYSLIFDEVREMKNMMTNYFSIKIKKHKQ